MSADYLCKLTTKMNELSASVQAMQINAGLYADTSDEDTLTGRIKALEESVISSDPTETNISRLKVDSGLTIVDGQFTTEFYPIGGCVNNEVMLQNPDDLDIWEPVGGVTFEEDIGSLNTDQYEGWLCTVSYIYAVKITLEEYEFIDVDEELVKDMSQCVGSVYRIKFTITPIDGEDEDEDADECVLKWENADDEEDYMEETITTEHVRTVDEEDFNNLLKITGSAKVVIEIRNRLG